MGIVSFLKRLFIKEDEKKNHTEKEHISWCAENFMIRRHEIEPIYSDFDIHERLQAFRKTGLSCLPVCGENFDDILGGCMLIDLAEVSKDNFNQFKKHDVAFVAPNTDIFEVFSYIYENKLCLVVVVDEFGGTDGIITEEAITRGLYYKYKADLQLSDKKSEFIVLQGKIPLSKIKTMLDINISEYDADTLGGFVSEHFGKTPQKGDYFIIKNVKFTVAESDVKSVKKVLINFLKEN